jgi:hypothetical protein
VTPAVRYPVPFAPPPRPALAGPAEGAAPLIWAVGLIGGAALLGWLIWPRRDEDDRYLPNYNPRWADLRQTLRESKAREKAASAERDRKLSLLSAQCRAHKQQITEQCRRERQRERAHARSVKAAEKRRRDDAWATYRWHSKDSPSARRAKRAPKMTKAESDSLAEHSVEPGLVPLWRHHRARFSYDLPPDERVERFMEFLHEHPDLEQAWMVEAMPSDADFAAAEREHYAEQIGDELEAVPF